MPTAFAVATNKQHHGSCAICTLVVHSSSTEYAVPRETIINRRTHPNSRVTSKPYLPASQRPAATRFVSAWSTDECLHSFQRFSGSKAAWFMDPFFFLLLLLATPCCLASKKINLYHKQISENSDTSKKSLDSGCNVIIIFFLLANRENQINLCDHILIWETLSGGRRGCTRMKSRRRL